ncbi:MAG: hypothetical protein NTX00_03610, partial [Candidatus Parcubacteria bacterium]|nr:hypothetical protein [Candidatus Parcubacteria bacterium]
IINTKFFSIFLTNNNKQTMKKKLKFLSLGSIVILILAMSLVVQNTALAGLSAVSVTLKDGSGNNISAPSTAVPSTQIKFTPDGDINTGDGIVLGFESDFNPNSVVTADLSITQVHTTDDIVKGAVSAGFQLVGFPITTESDTPDGAVTIDIINSHITTASTGGTYTITIMIYDLGDDGLFGGVGVNADTVKDAGWAAVVIAPISGVGTNLVQITGQVDPTLSLTLSATTCALSTLLSTAVNTCQYNTTVSTNAAAGYTAFIRDNHKLESLTNSALNIDDVGDGETTAGSEEYGVATSDTDSVDITTKEASADCTTANGGTDPVDALALTTDDQSYATEDAPADADVVTLCHSASISGTTTAGSYAQTVTITVVGNF